MRELVRQPIFGRRFIGHFWSLIAVYWRSSDAPRGMLLLAGAVLLEIGTVYANLRLADAERRIMDAVQDKQATIFLEAASGAAQPALQKADMRAVDIGVFGHPFLREIAGKPVPPNDLTEDRGQLRVRHRVGAVAGRAHGRLDLDRVRPAPKLDANHWPGRKGWVPAAAASRLRGVEPRFRPPSGLFWG